MNTVIQASTKIDLEDAAVAGEQPDNSTDRELVAQLVDQAPVESGLSEQQANDGAGDEVPPSR